MQILVHTFEGEALEEVHLPDHIFGVEPRVDLMHRVVRWQLAKRRSGNHKVKNRSEVDATGRKFVKQKGSGGARHGSRKVPQFRGGGRAFGPCVRDHTHSLPKEIRRIALCHALSYRFSSGEMTVLDSLALSEPKTRLLRQSLFSSLTRTGPVLVVDAEMFDVNLMRAAQNLPNLDLLPVRGLNVYDILRCSALVLTRASIPVLERRLS